MRPGDHPEFFRFPAPEGRSRESTIVLDAEGRFFHHGELVEHPGMARAFASWIDVHPDDGRFILNNGYDWSYFRVEDVPFFVLGLRQQDAELRLLLSDGSESPLEPGSAGRRRARRAVHDGQRRQISGSLHAGGANRARSLARPSRKRRYFLGNRRYPSHAREL